MADLMTEYGKWEYYVQLDGDYARECESLSEALEVQAHAHGLIAPTRRRIWRERIVTEEIR